jgi:t-SNARE complex subunit (syntaxin)
MDSRFVDIVDSQSTQAPKDDSLLNKKKSILKIIQVIDHAKVKVEGQISHLILEPNSIVFERMRKEIDNSISTTTGEMMRAKNIFDNFVEIEHDKFQTELYGYLMKKFVTSTTVFNDVILKYKGGLGDRVKREIKIVHPNFTEDEVENFKVGMEQGATLFKQTFISEEHSKAKQKLQYYKEMYTDIIDIERQIIQLKQLFIDASILIAQQGDIVDNIEYNVAKSLVRIQAGNEQLEGAVKKSQKCVMF